MTRMSLRQGNEDMILMSLHPEDRDMTPMLLLLEGDMTPMLLFLEGDMILMRLLLEGEKNPILMFHHLVGRTGRKILMHLRRVKGRRTLIPTCLHPEEAISQILTHRHQE